MKRFNISFKVSRNISLDSQVIKDAIKWPKVLMDKDTQDIIVLSVAKMVAEEELRQRLILENESSEWRMDSNSSEAE